VNADDRIQTIADILPYRAEATPQRVALVELDANGELRRTAFGQLKQQADAVAAQLLNLGVARGQAVAILMRNSVNWVACYHAIFRLGAIAVPIEHAMFETDAGLVLHTLDDADVGVVICDPPDQGRVAELAGEKRQVLVGQEARAGAGHVKLPRPAVKPDDLAQILYTSGTTGPKKGVELTHGNVIFDVRACCRRFGVSPKDCLAALLPYHHAYPLTTTVVLPALAGARMAVGDITDRRSRELLRKCRPTVFVGVPRVFESIMDSVRTAVARSGRLAGFERGQALSAFVKRALGINPGKVLFQRLHRELFGGLQLRFCVSGGARIAPGLLREYFLLGIPVVQGWGMSELSPVAAAQPFRPARFYFGRYYERKAGSIGTALDGTEMLLAKNDYVDSSANDDACGEIVVRGPHVMRGYHSDPARTAQQMTEQGLHSGDIARRDGDGDLYIIGRIKHVIVLPSGKKVFPEQDLDEDLSRCPTIQEFAIRPIEDESGREKIGIVIRPNLDALKAGGARTLGELYAEIKADLDRALAGKPDYMREYDFCLTPWQGDDYAQVVKTAMGEPSPLRTPFHPEAAYSRMKGSAEKAPFET